ELRVPPLARHVLASVAEGVRAGDGDERARLAQPAQRQPHAGVRVAARERQAARGLRARQGDLLRALYAGLARRAHGAVELAERRFIAEPRERLAGFLRAAVELLHPRVAEAERRRKLEAPAVGRRRCRQLGAMQAEELA